MKIFKKYSPIALLLIILLMATPMQSQGPPPPPPDNHGEGGNTNAGNAPIGGGVFILLGLAALYGGKKTYDLNKERLEEQLHFAD